MAVKDYFVPFNILRVQIQTREIGPISMITTEYLKMYGDKVDPVSGHQMKEMMYLPYPFQTSFAGFCVDYTADREDIKEEYNQWYELNRADVDSTSELPVHANMCTFENYFQGRLERILKNCITPEEYNTYGDRVLFIDQDRTNYAFCMASNSSVEEAFFMVKCSDEDCFKSILRDGEEGDLPVRIRLSSQVTCGGEVGKILVGTFQNVPFKSGPMCRRYLMNLSKLHVRDGFTLPTLHTSYPLYNLTADRLKEMVDFGDYPAVPNRNALIERAFPLEQHVGYHLGESLHNNTTFFSSLWQEY